MAKQPTFELAPQARVDRFETEVRRILDVLGEPDALVTDESMLLDFSSFGQGLGDAELHRIAVALGLPLRDESLIADLAESLRGLQDS